MKKISLLLAMILTFSLIFAGCGQDTTLTSGDGSEKSENASTSAEYPFEIIDSKDEIEAEIILENGKKIELELYPDIAPVTVSNFVYLAKDKFYDGLIFHRVIEGFMIQGGCPNGTGTGGPNHRIKGEFASNGFENTLQHTRGVISMARSSMPDSAGSQFFIMHKEATHLDGEYAAFGRVVNGMEVVDEIATAPTGANDRPLEEIKIKTIKIKQNEKKTPVNETENKTTVESKSASETNKDKNDGGIDLSDIPLTTFELKD